MSKISDSSDVGIRGQLIMKVDQIHELKKDKQKLEEYARQQNELLETKTRELKRKDDEIVRLQRDLDQYRDVLSTIFKANEGTIKVPKESNISILPPDISHLIVSLLLFTNIFSHM